MEAGSSLACIREVDPEHTVREVGRSADLQLVWQCTGVPQPAFLRRHRLLRWWNRNVVRMPLIVGRLIRRGIRQCNAVGVGCGEIEGGNEKECTAVDCHHRIHLEGAAVAPIVLSSRLLRDANDDHTDLFRKLNTSALARE